MDISDKLPILKEAARAQVPDATLAGLVGMDEGEFQTFLIENEDIKRTLFQERAEGRYELISQLYQSAALGTNHKALIDALTGLCGLKIEPKSSTKVEINGYKGVEASADGISDEALYLIERIHSSPNNITKEKAEKIERILEENATH